MDARISLNEHEAQWRVLLYRQASFQHSQQLTSSQKNTQVDDDPFDCSSLVLPTLPMQAEQVVDDALQQWEQLEERKVISGERNPTWYENHVRLPDYFDYTTRGNPPVDNGEGNRVVSLDDPSIHLSYERALWDLLASVPNASQVVRRDHELTRTQDVLREISQGFKDYSRIDGHGLARLRMKDRHGLPQSNDSQLVSTISFECWRKLPGRFGAVEPNRMVLEFLGTQTLLDVHRAIMELADDRLWDRARSDGIDSGFFFIEGVFYGIGQVDYITPIRSWLLSDDHSASRLKLLGLDGVPISANSMQCMALNELEMRLGVRYVHVCHGDVECSIYLIDRKISAKQPIKYPIIHDIWSPSFVTAVDCEACSVRTATIATSTLCPESLGHRLLCKPCCRQLRIPDVYVEDFRIWKGQSDLSAGTGIG